MNEPCRTTRNPANTVFDPHRISALGLGLAPLIFMVFFTDPWPWRDSYLTWFLVFMGSIWLVRIITIYKLVGPRATAPLRS
jgi:hypothetical protein